MMISGIQNSAVWNSLSKSISEAIEAVQDSIVTIHGGGRSTSSGVVWRPGVVVTVRNGLRRGEVIKVARGGEPFNASVAGTDAGTDLAVLRLESNSLKPAETSDLESTRVGELVLSVGRSVLGDISASSGIIARLGSPWRTWRGGGRLTASFDLMFGFAEARAAAHLGTNSIVFWGSIARL